MRNELLSDSIRSPSRLNYRDESSGAITNSGDTTFGRRWNNRDSSKKHNRRRNKVSFRSGYKWKPSFGLIHPRVYPSVKLQFSKFRWGKYNKTLPRDWDYKFRKKPRLVCWWSWLNVLHSSHFCMLLLGLSKKNGSFLCSLIRLWSYCSFCCNSDNKRAISYTKNILKP